MTPDELRHLLNHPFFNYAFGFVIASVCFMVIEYILKSDDE